MRKCSVLTHPVVRGWLWPCPQVNQSSMVEVAEDKYIRDAAHQKGDFVAVGSCRYRIFRKQQRKQLEFLILILKVKVECFDLF